MDGAAAGSKATKKCGPGKDAQGCWELGSNLGGWVTAVPKETEPPAPGPFPFCVRKGERWRPRRNSLLKLEDG